MALSANTVWEVRTGGADTNGGGFVTGASGTDYSQQNGSNTTGNNISTTDAVTAASTTVTSTTASFTAAIVGNIIYLAGGTGSLTAGRYQVTAFTNSTTITIDRAPGASATVTMNIGGALGSPGGAGAVMAASGVAGMTIWIATGTYTLSNTTQNTSNGPVKFVTTAATGSPITWEGYNTSRGDLGSPPVISAGTQTTLTIMTGDGASAGSFIINIIVDGNLNTSTTGMADGGKRLGFYLCAARNCTNGGFVMTNGGGAGATSLVISCRATGCTTAQSGFLANGVSAYFAFCEASGNSVPGFQTAGVFVFQCLSYANTGATGIGFQQPNSASGPLCLFNCVAYGNGSDGAQIKNTTGYGIIANCVFEGNGGWGIGGNSTAQQGILFLNNATYNNTSGGIDTNFAKCFQARNVAYTASAFVAPGSGNFALNNTAGGGASLRAAGYFGTTPSGNSVGHIDIGAIQHQDSGTNIFIIDD